jgi:hypothetical protein
MKAHIHILPLAIPFESKELSTICFPDCWYGRYNRRVRAAVGALLGSTVKKKAGKEQFQAVKGRKRKDGTTGKAYIRKKAKS